ncbi:hypothetical protein D9M71_671220 [compost metagenome]
MAGFHQDFAAAQDEPALVGTEVDIQGAAAVQAHPGAVGQLQFALFAAGGHFVGQPVAERAMLAEQAEPQASQQGHAEHSAAGSVQPLARLGVGTQQGAAGGARGGGAEVGIEDAQLGPGTGVFGVGGVPAAEGAALLVAGLARIQAELPADGLVQHLCRYRAALHVGSP